MTMTSDAQRIVAAADALLNADGAEAVYINDFVALNGRMFGTDSVGRPYRYCVSKGA